MNEKIITRSKQLIAYISHLHNLAELAGLVNNMRRLKVSLIRTWRINK